MTTQIRDRFILEDESFYLWLGEGEGFFDPDEHGIQRGFGGTACYRGYYSTYHLQNQQLELFELVVGRNLERVGTFNGIAPQQIGRDEPGYSKVGYTNIGLKIPFTGGLILAREWATGERSIGPELLWRFVHVKELIFENGNLVQLFDRSAAMAELRERFIQTQADISFPEIQTSEIMKDYSQRAYNFYLRMEIEIDECLALNYHERTSDSSAAEA